YAGSALAGAVFPRAAVFGDRDAAILTATATRVCFLAAAATSLVLVVVMPTLIPRLFGDAFRGAVWPAIVVSLASLASGPQMIVARAAAARHRTHVYVGSYGTSTALML